MSHYLRIITQLDAHNDVLLTCMGGLRLAPYSIAHTNWDLCSYQPVSVHTGRTPRRRPRRWNPYTPTGTGVKNQLATSQNVPGIVSGNTHFHTSHRLLSYVILFWLKVKFIPDETKRPEAKSRIL